MATRFDAHPHDHFALWHVPTSTLVLASDTPADIMRRIESMTATGCALEELLLNIERAGHALDAQYLGGGILAALTRYLNGG